MASVGDRLKVIIDTDPGVDDSMTIFMATQSPQLEILGLTTIFGNVTTETATLNALRLRELTNRSDIPVAEGCHEPLMGGKPRARSRAHGEDGLGNITLNPETSNQVPLVPKSKKIDKTASQVMVEMVSKHPGEVSILALGPLTNLALAVKWDSSFARKVKQVVVLGGSFFALGNVNPAAESNIMGDPEAADIVFTSGANIVIVGINVSMQVKLTGDELDELRQSSGRCARIIANMCKFVQERTEKSYKFKGIFLHDPTSFVALVRPELFTYTKGVVRVETQGKCRGLTLMDPGTKEWDSDSGSPWTVEAEGIGKPVVSVASTVEADEVRDYVVNLLAKP